MREFLLENDEMLDNNKNKIPFLLSVHHLVAEGGLALKKVFVICLFQACRHLIYIIIRYNI